ncbi:hypothetical protein [Catellatospora methionotrophica]|uniref:hypothetical protein n=1 Tax=Catellatospora methionotrophica TaxID=121620 RepID=UPI0033F12FED
MGATDWTGVRERVEALRARPGSERLFGADTHGFTLAPALSGGELADLETWLGVRLQPGPVRFSGAPGGPGRPWSSRRP